MTLSHMAPSSFNMSSYRAIWIHFRQISMIFEQTEIPKSIHMNFQIAGKQVLICQDIMFSRLLFASTNDTKPYRRNIMGLNFQKHF